VVGNKVIIEDEVARAMKNGQLYKNKSVRTA